MKNAVVAHHYAGDAGRATRALELAQPLHAPLHILVQGIGEPGLADRCAEITATGLREQLVELTPASPSEAEAALQEAIQSVQRRLLDNLAEGEHPGTGATLVASWHVGDTAVIGHLGQCRAYRRRGDALERLTDDHSTLFAFCQRQGIEPEDLEDWPRQYGDQILRGLGFMDPVELEVHHHDVQPGDVYILATDALQAALDGEALVAALHQEVQGNKVIAQSVLRAIRDRTEARDVSVAVVEVS